MRLHDPHQLLLQAQVQRGATAAIARRGLGRGGRVRASAAERLQQHRVALAALLQRPALALKSGGPTLVSSTA